MVAFLALALCACRKQRPAPTPRCGLLAVTPCGEEMESAPIVTEALLVTSARAGEMTSRTALGSYVMSCAYPLVKGPSASDETFVGLETCTLQEEPACPGAIPIRAHVPARAVALRKNGKGDLAVTLQVMGATRGVPLVCFERRER